MAQAAQIIPFPSKKLTFKPMKIDLSKVLASYDAKRSYVVATVKLLGMSPKKVRQSVVTMRDDIAVDAAARLITDLEELSRDFLALSEMADAAAARLTAGHRNLI